MAQGADPMQAYRYGAPHRAGTAITMCTCLMEYIVRSGRAPSASKRRCGAAATARATPRTGVCDPGFDGHDCGRKQCPKGPVWKYDKLEYHECSNKGLCMLGVCGCHPSYTGKACERLAAQATALGVGAVSGWPFYREMATFSRTAWDGEMLQSCRCGTPHNGQGAYGHDCQFFRCTADDPSPLGSATKCN